MQRPENASSVRFVARISTLDRQAIAAVFPMYGGSAWFLETALRAFLALVEHKPEIARAIHRDIERMRYEEGPPGNHVDFGARLPSDLYHAFNGVFGEQGATTWFIRRVVAALAREAQKHPTPEDLVNTAVASMFEGLSDG